MDFPSHAPDSSTSLPQAVQGNGGDSQFITLCLCCPFFPQFSPLLQHEFSPRACSCGGSSGAAAFFRQEPHAVQVLGGHRRGPLQCSHHPNRGTSLPTSLCPVQPLRAFFLFFSYCTTAFFVSRLRSCGILAALPCRPLPLSAAFSSDEGP